MNATFRRPLKTNDTSRHFQITPNQIISLCHAQLGKGEFLQHDKKGSGKLPLNLSGGATYITTSQYGDDYKEHGVYMTVVWLGIIQFGVIFARYFKWSSLGIFLHMVTGIIGLGMVMWSAIKIYKKDQTSYEQLSEKERYHSRMGLTVCSIIIGQVFLGFLTKYQQMFTNRIYQMMVSSAMHKALGWALIIIGMTNLKYGWHLYDDNDKLNIIYTMYAVLCVLYVILEAFARLQNYIPFLAFKPFKYLIKPKDSQARQLGDPLIDTRDGDITHIDILQKIQQEQKKWVFYDEYILDISFFMMNHPGGYEVLKRAIGEDVGKYLNGCSSIIQGTMPYSHSDLARSYINPLVIGEVSFPKDFIIPTNGGSLTEMTFILREKIEIADMVFQLEFSSHDFSVNTKLPSSLEWMGKHFLVKYVNKLKTIRRYYSVVNVHIGEWSEELAKEGVNIVQDVVPSISINYKEALRLYVKRYPDGQGSRYMTDLNPGDAVILKGPLGPGLALNTFPKGLCLGFGAGTGVLPFMDLAYFIWQGKAPQDFCLKLYISFRTRREGICIQLLEATQRRFPQNLNLHINLDEQGLEGRLTQNKLKDWTNLSEVFRAWTCGPSGFNNWIAGMLYDEGIQWERIFIL